MPPSLKNIFKTKLSRDILWNYTSFGVVAVNGVLINIIIAGIYGAATLGVFNQVYAIYIISAMFASGGVHLSVLKHIAEFKDNRKKCDQIVSSAVALSLTLGTITGIMVYSLRNIFGNLLESPEIIKGVSLIAPALVFFSINKVLLVTFVSGGVNMS